MKRTLAIILMLILLVPVTGALASRLEGYSSTPSPSSTSSEEEYASLTDAVAACLDTLGYTYSYDEAKNRFTFTFLINSTLGTCEMVINMKADGFNVYAYSPIRPKSDDPDMLAAVAEYITRANYGITLGNFELDFNDGEVRYMTSILCFDRIPSQEEIEWVIDIPWIMLERYGDGLAQVILIGADPAEAVAEAETETE